MCKPWKYNFVEQIMLLCGDKFFDKGQGLSIDSSVGTKTHGNFKGKIRQSPLLATSFTYNSSTYPPL